MTIGSAVDLSQIDCSVLSPSRVSDHVEIRDWEDTTQREAAVAELQAFCSASIKQLGLEAFKPCLLKGAVANWPAVDKWSLDWLVQQYGSQR